MNKYRKRQEEVLEVIIRHYIDTAEPVGSRFVARRLGLSSATIRNAMADLEDNGFITHPYTSAGRVPTDKGYRYYIDSLMHLKRVSEHIVKAIDEQYKQAVRSLEELLERTSHLMSDLTSYIGITLSPREERFYMDGASHILTQPEFRDFRKLYNILKCLEEKREIMASLRDDLNEEGIKIRIGKENKIDDLSECSVVTRGYKVKGMPAGRLGIIGPKRMVYEKVIPTIEIMADTLSDILERFEI